MIAEALYGKEEWVADINGKPVIDGYDEHGFTMTVPTEHGDLTIMVSKGEPEFTFTAEDAVQLGEALRKRFEERHACT